MWPCLFSQDKKRKRLLQKAEAGPCYEYYSHKFIHPRKPFTDVSYAVLDFETTGLDVIHDHVLSIGYIEINQFGITLDSAWHQIIKTERELPEETTIIHQITDDMVAQGMALSDAMPVLLEKLQGKVLIAHHAQIELGFMDKITRALYRSPFLIPHIDTQKLASRQLKRQGEEIRSGDLRLFNLSARYGLPEYRAHNAMYDALACAELFLLLASELYPKLDARVCDLY